MKRVSGGLIFLLALGFGIRSLGAPSATSVHASKTVSACAAQAMRLAPVDQEWKGAGRCASAACHNANGPQGSKRSEYTTWATADKHALAYQVLETKRSQIIERNWKAPGKNWEDAQAVMDADCLKCHALNTDDPLKQLKHGLAPDDGVTCENCHGPAGKWLGEHVRADWRAKSPQEKAADGLVDLSVGNLAGRVRVCVDCHVGNAARGMEVNHDLIAAGHPRLNFEFSAFLANYPKHWDERAEKEKVPDLEAKSWALGQVISAQAAVELTAFRAAEKNQRPWPEFAEYDCFACHHDLVDPSWRQARGYLNRKPGSYPWGSWYLAEAPTLLQLPGESRPTDIVKDLTTLREAMSRSFPDRKAVGDAAQKVSGDLTALADRARSAHFNNVDALRGLAQQIETQAESSETTWDAAAQRYLALAAIYQAQADVGHTQLDQRQKSELEALMRRLAFPRDNKVKFDSPRDFRPMAPGK